MKQVVNDIGMPVREGELLMDQRGYYWDFVQFDPDAEYPIGVVREGNDPDEVDWYKPSWFWLTVKEVEPKLPL